MTASPTSAKAPMTVLRRLSGVDEAIEAYLYGFFALDIGTHEDLPDDSALVCTGDAMGDDAPDGGVLGVFGGELEAHLVVCIAEDDFLDFEGFTGSALDFELAGEVGARLDAAEGEARGDDGEVAEDLGEGLCAFDGASWIIGAEGEFGAVESDGCIGLDFDENACGREFFLFSADGADLGVEDFDLEDIGEVGCGHGDLEVIGPSGDEDFLFPGLALVDLPELEDARLDDDQRADMGLDSDACRGCEGVVGADGDGARVEPAFAVWVEDDLDFAFFTRGVDFLIDIGDGTPTAGLDLADDQRVWSCVGEPELGGLDGVVEDIAEVVCGFDEVEPRGAGFEFRLTLREWGQRRGQGDACSNGTSECKNRGEDGGSRGHWFPPKIGLAPGVGASAG